MSLYVPTTGVNRKKQSEALNEECYCKGGTHYNLSLLYIKYREMKLTRKVYSKMTTTGLYTNKIPMNSLLFRLPIGISVVT